MKREANSPATKGRSLSKRERVALFALAGSSLIVGFGWFAAYGVLREYADVCGATSAVEQVWFGGAGLGPLVAMVAIVLAFAVAVIGGHRLRAAAAGLFILAVVGVTVSGALGISGKQAAFEAKPETYGVCSGYNSSR